MAGLAAAAAVPSGIVLKVLTANNYEDWSFRVKTYLLAKGLWKVVESAKEPPRVEGGDEAEFEAWNEKNAEALHAIHISCGEDIFPFIRGIDTAKAAWNTLEKKLKPAGARLPKREGIRTTQNKPNGIGLLESLFDRYFIINFNFKTIILEFRLNF